MKKHFTRLAFIALFALTPAIHADGRISSGETAVRIGVDAWFNAWSTHAERPDSRFLPALYSTALRGSAGVPPRPPVLARFAQWAAKRSDDLSVVLRGDEATTTFTFMPEGVDNCGQPLKASARVILVWERRDGFWQIFCQQTAEAPGIALSASAD